MSRLELEVRNFGVGMGPFPCISESLHVMPVLLATGGDRYPQTRLCLLVGRGPQVNPNLQSTRGIV